jgi:hypothetical protein
MTENTTLAQSAPKLAAVPVGPNGLQLATLDDAYRLSKYISQSGWAPKGMDTPESILVAIQFGMEVGLSPMSALQSLAVINGRPSIYGDAALGLVRASGLLESYSQLVDGAGDARQATVTVKRRNEEPLTSVFGVADAKRANLWGKAGPWTQYPDRMLVFRARGFALRDAFGDVLKGLVTREEALDYPPERNVTPITLPSAGDAAEATVAGLTPEAKKPETTDDAELFPEGGKK